MEYDAVIPVLTSAIQELKAQKDTEIAKLQAANDALAARLARLEAAIGQRPAQVTTAALDLK